MDEPSDGGTLSLRVVGVVPAFERTRRMRLLDTLEAAYPVRFEGREPGGLSGVDAVLALGTTGMRAARDPPPGVPCLCCREDERVADHAGALALSEDPGLAAPLRGARLTEAHASGLTPLPVASGDLVLATLSGSPAWVRHATERGRHDHVAIAPDELRPGEVLRNRLAPRRCLAMLALTQFVRDITAGLRWEPPATRAAFVVDDPNLRWPTYGHLSFEELSCSARAHAYHVSIAMVPLDAWPAHPRAVALFRERSAQLSLSIHGNDHDRGELGRLRSEEEALGPVAQALRRVQGFERRTALAVDRVMVPPHERMSEGALAAMLACGYEAFAGTRSYPWIDMGTSPDVPWLTRPDGAHALIGWGSAVLMPGGFPLLMRIPLEHAGEELVMRAFLGQPVILYGHHDLLEHGPEALETAAAAINRLGDTRWSSLAGIARAAVESRRRGDVLELRMLGRHVCVDVPSWADELLIDLTALCVPEGAQLLVRRPGAGPSVIGTHVGRARLAVERPGRVELSLPSALDPRSVPAPRRRLSPVARRLASEVRPRTRQVAVRRRGGT